MCGNFIGRITIYDLKNYVMVGKINSHLKMITCIDCNWKFNEIISGSEDTFLNFWKIDEKNEITLKVSYRLAD